MTSLLYFTTLIFLYSCVINDDIELQNKKIVKNKNEQAKDTKVVIQDIIYKENNTPSHNVEHTVDDNINMAGSSKLVTNKSNNSGMNDLITSDRNSIKNNDDVIVSIEDIGANDWSQNYMHGIIKTSLHIEQLHNLEINHKENTIRSNDINQEINYDENTIRSNDSSQEITKISEEINQNGKSTQKFKYIKGKTIIINLFYSLVFIISLLFSYESYNNFFKKDYYSGSFALLLVITCIILLILFFTFKNKNI